MDENEKKSEYEFIREHAIMKRIIVENGLWETLLNDAEFNEYMREEYTGESNLEKYINENTCLRCGKGKPAYCEDCMQKVIAENAELQRRLVNAYVD